MQSTCLLLHTTSQKLVSSSISWIGLSHDDLKNNPGCGSRERHLLSTNRRRCAPDHWFNQVGTPSFVQGSQVISVTAPSGIPICPIWGQYTWLLTPKQPAPNKVLRGEDSLHCPTGHQLIIQIPWWHVLRESSTLRVFCRLSSIMEAGKQSWLSGECSTIMTWIPGLSSP